MDPAEKFLRHVDRSAGPDGCWPWTGYVHPTSGYGVWAHRRESTTAHRWAWRLLVGPIPDDHLHHRCENRRCVNVAHLEPIAAGEHARLTLVTGRCRSGRHALEGGNVGVKKNGDRYCRECNRQRQREGRARRST